MLAFWEALLGPLMAALRPRVILEIGADAGTTTRALLSWADSHAATVHVIDPSPAFEPAELLAEHPGSLVFHAAPSLEVLPGLDAVDVALVDGDHNHYTVLNELRWLARRSEAAGALPPVVALHDVGWPYGRRDLYYEPDRIPAGERRPFERGGLRPGADELFEDGLNPHLAHAKLPAPRHSGVLGAIEDFIAGSEREWRLFDIPGQHGLGVLAAAEVLAGRVAVRDLLEATREPEFLRGRLEAVERARVETEISRANAERAARPRARREGAARLAAVRVEAGAARRDAETLRVALEDRKLEVTRLRAEVLGLRARLGRAEAEADVARARRSAVERRLRDMATLHEATLTDLAAVELSRQAFGERKPPARAATAAIRAEREALAAFTSEYAPFLADGADALAVPSAQDRRGVLRGRDQPAADGRRTVDVVVCVRDALDDVRRCLWSLVAKGSHPFHLIVVDDGSGPETTAYLEETAALNRGMTLIHNATPPHGYTIAANQGVRASRGDYVILLNSDTIVTPGWLERLVACGESDDRIGVLGPLSNAASHQSVPAVRDATGWAVNSLPAFATADGLARLLDRVGGPPSRPRLPFINGFCYVVKRAVFDTIGHFDEENFASGYCEENDFSYRAAQAGFELAVADDCYVFHAKSRSFAPANRDRLARRNYEIFLRKHGAEEIGARVDALESDTSLSPLRHAIGRALDDRDAFASALLAEARPLSIAFVLPDLGLGGSGGSHSIYQEVQGLRRLGAPARILLAERAWERAVAVYADAEEVFEPYDGIDDLAERTADADVISATHFKSVAAVAALRSRRADFLPAYYVQDYEPFFADRAGDVLREAMASYAAIPGCLLFAKTHWLCNIIAARHGLHVAKVEPSLDTDLFRPGAPRAGNGPLRVAAMVRPRTPRRQPGATCTVLESLLDRLGDGVETVTFGCSDAELEGLTRSPRLLESHRGLISREDVAATLRGADVFLDMSMYQAFGRTALEAMGCGSAAVVPRVGGIWEFAVDGVNAYAVDTSVPDTAVAAIAALAGNRERLRAMQEAALRTAGSYSIARAALSEYLVFAAEHARLLHAEHTPA